eukprot:483821-Hanusia_phi.AAC.1
MTGTQNRLEHEAVFHDSRVGEMGCQQADSRPSHASDGASRMKGCSVPTGSSPRRSPIVLIG